MSFTTLKMAKEDGVFHNYKTFQNSHGFGPAIWGHIADKYVISPNKIIFDRWIDAWKEAKPSGTISASEKLVLLCTFDNAVLKGENAIETAASLRVVGEEYEKEHPNYVCHLKAMADALEEGVKEGARYFAWYGTSLVDDPWWLNPEDDDEDDDGEPYNINTGNKHWFI